MSTGFKELDGVLGGGLVPASLLLVGGDPGHRQINAPSAGVPEYGHAGASYPLYFRRGVSAPDEAARRRAWGVLRGDLRFLSETNLDVMTEVLKKYKPEVVIIDSIQTMFRDDVGSAPGSVGQVRGYHECTDAAGQRTWYHDLYCRSCDEGRHGGRSTDAGAHGGYEAAVLFEGERNASDRILRGVEEPLRFHE